MSEELRIAPQERGIAAETEVLRDLLTLSFNQGHSFAAWRLPNHAEKKVLLSFSPTPFDTKSPIENLEAGFLFCPFDRTKPGHYLKADLMFSFRDGQLANPETPLESDSQSWLKSQSGPTRATVYYTPRDPKEVGSDRQQDFLELTRDCIHLIEQGKFEKVVPSRCRTIPLPEGFDTVGCFQKLCEAYPNALISLVSLPHVGTWLGASPEILVSVENKSTFRTTALAGTQNYQPGINLRHVAWTQKEIEEQALVSRYIINCFKKIRLREFEEHGPKTVVAGNLMHLKTDFSVDMMATNFPQLGSVMLDLLHPTSAVCGMPMEAAMDFLKKHEGYEREFYAGFLGPVNIEDHIQLFVNLRCLQLLEHQALCYAGSGITVDSIPEKEWEETEMKMNTLIHVIS